MHWFKPNLRSSIHAIFSASHPHDSQAVVEDIGMDDIRDAMLALLGGAEGDRATHVKRRIRYAGDVQALWFLRGDLTNHREARSRGYLRHAAVRLHLPSGLTGEIEAA